MRKILKYLIPILCNLFLVAENITSQQNNTLFLMHDLPQANIVNPSVLIPCKLYVGLPLLGSTHLNAYSSGFTFNDLFEKRADGLFHFAPEEAVSKANKYEIIAAEAHIALLSFGYRHKQNYFTFRVNEKFTTYNIAHRNLAKLALNGNSQFEGENADLGNLRINANHYREYSFGWATEINNKLSLGAKAKFLFGKGNIYTKPTKINLYTDAKTFQLNLNAKLDSYLSLPIDIETNANNELEDISIRDNIDTQNYLTNRDNVGFGIDLGITYDINDLYTFSASILDIGYLNWNSNTKHLSSNGTLNITGSTFENGLNDSGEMADTLNTVFNPQIGQSSYISPLVPTMYMGLTRVVSNNIKLGAVIHSELYKKRMHSSLTLSANTQIISKHLYASLSYTVQNNQFNNLGIGVGSKIGPFHFHAITDNLPAFFNLLNARNINLRFGISLLIECKNTKTKQFHNNKPNSGALPCFYNPYNKSIRK